MELWALNQNGKFAKHMARRLGQSRQSAWAPSGNSGLRVRVTWAARPRCRTWLGRSLALCPWASHSTSLWLFVHLQNKDNNSISVRICKILSTVPLAHSRHFFFFFLSTSYHRYYSILWQLWKSKECHRAKDTSVILWPKCVRKQRPPGNKLGMAF